jgi:hypothetical protein
MAISTGMGFTRPPIVNHAQPEEERAGRDSVADHLENRALKRNRGEGKNSQDHKSQVADGGVSNQPLEIGLDGRDQRAVNDADDCEDAD